MTFRGFYFITRPVNSIVSGLAAILGYIIATGTITLSSLILILIVAIITAAGNVINDYFDADIDAINRPKRPIPSGDVRRSSARIFATILFLCGILLSLFSNVLCLTIVVLNSLVLIIYAAKLKSSPFIGNLAISYLAASIFLFGGAFAGLSGLIQNIPIAIITFLAMLARELLKDAEDVKGDSIGGARTLPIKIGIQKTGRIALIVAVLGVGASIIPFFRWGAWYLAGIAFVDLIILIAVIRALPCKTPDCVKMSYATSILKTGMFASLLIFTFFALGL